MTDTIHLPGMGETKKSTVYVMVGGLVLVGGIAYYRSKKQAAQNASVAQAGSTTTNPATGYPYGSAEDAAALSAQANYNQGYSGAGGGYYPYSTSTPGTIQTGFTSNAQWAQAYESYATQNLQSDASVVAAALGKYLTGQPLTSDQLSIVEQAIAFQGIPPQSGTNGFPPSYNMIPNGGTPPGSGTGVPAKVVADGYYRDATEGGAIYKVVNNQVWHVTGPYWATLNPKPPVTPVGPGWLGRVGIPYAGEL